MDKKREKKLYQKAVQAHQSLSYEESSPCSLRFGSSKKFYGLYKPRYQPRKKSNLAKPSLPTPAEQAERVRQSHAAYDAETRRLAGQEKPKIEMTDNLAGIE